LSESYKSRYKKLREVKMVYFYDAVFFRYKPFGFISKKLI